MFPLKDNIPTDRFPVVTVSLIVINVLMYFLFQKAGITHGPDETNVVKFGAIPYEISHPGDQCVLVDGSQLGCTDDSVPNYPPTWQTVFTSMFMHGSILHIAGNMLFLWIFGNNVEDSMGPVKFVIFYIGGGLAALAAQTIVNPDAAVPTIGASGAVAAVLGGYLLLFPGARVLTVVFIIFFFTLIEIPALLFLVIWFGQQILFGALDWIQPTKEGGGVAYFAHIGGFAFGLLLIRVFATRERKTPPPPRRRQQLAWR